MMTFGAALALAPMARAESYADQIVQQLAGQGFVNIQVEFTLLGRVRIKGQTAQGLREIILNPNTGEILRDMWLDANGNPILPRLVNSNSASNSGSGSGSHSGSDDDGNDDNSGSGSGDDNSGSDDDDEKDDDEKEDDDGGKDD
jgi:hypothetical protein